jgi:DNA-directed RNA polymerase sigma subunit (sigma70/sigma32)
MTAGRDVMTYREIARAMGLSHGRVEQIEKIALKKLRRRWIYDPETGQLYRAISVLRRAARAR